MTIAIIGNATLRRVLWGSFCTWRGGGQVKGGKCFLAERPRYAQAQGSETAQRKPEM